MKLRINNFLLRDRKSEILIYGSSSIYRKNSLQTIFIFKGRKHSFRFSQVNFLTKLSAKNIKNSSNGFSLFSCTSSKNNK